MAWGILEHSYKGSTWKKHKYTSINSKGTYIYPKSTMKAYVKKKEPTAYMKRKTTQKVEPPQDAKETGTRALMKKATPSLKSSKETNTQKLIKAIYAPLESKESKRKQSEGFKILDKIMKK